MVAFAFKVAKGRQAKTGSATAMHLIAQLLVGLAGAAAASAYIVPPSTAVDGAFIC